MFEQLFWSLTHRPYITLFLITFLLLSWLEQGKLRTGIWVISSYLVALLAEWGSINYGIPFGRYVYHYEALSNDLVVFGVPFFDSLSFSFLSYVSFSLAQFFMSPLWIKAYDVQRVTPAEVRNSVPVLLLGAFLMLVVDLIVDPIANLGRYWFLGDIYHYPEPGVHFGVTLANYAGWYIVATVTIFLNQRIDRILMNRERRRGEPVRLAYMPCKGLFALCFWSGIVIFQLGVTYWLAYGGEPIPDQDRLKLQALTGSFIIAPILVLAVMQLLKPSNRVHGDDVREQISTHPVGASVQDKAEALGMSPPSSLLTAARGNESSRSAR
ncbi:carotenoid biosynthesis protein [Methylocaldum szegediense]|jgi:putative membrane protein|uniref:Membrane protein n=1 Tax=Methylocaldum szegediense TaxID=73780 RepID=A0ABM9I5V6_9GAMM|nr:carotenoid biosynthesis protein [Methylocaldum szegediense]CAI8911587.1 putative membrane protein [Methylocaldum szegediense]